MKFKKPCDGVEFPASLYTIICLMYITIILASFAISAVIYCIARNSRRAEPQAGSVSYI